MNRVKWLLKKSDFKLAGMVEFQGLKIAIENKKGSWRHWHDPNTGKDGKTFMRYSYGYIRFTEGPDGDGVDCYIGPNRESRKVFVVHQQNPKTEVYDEDKVMLGFDRAGQAKKVYIGQYDSPKFFQSMDEWAFDEFVRHVKSKKKHYFI